MAAIGACAGFWCDLRLVAGHGGDDGPGGAARTQARRLAGRLATGTLAAGGTLGILIPPSIVLVIYAILAEQNIAKLFAAAFIPGILAAMGYMIVINIFVRLNPSLPAACRRCPGRERWQALGASGRCR